MPSHTQTSSLVQTCNDLLTKTYSSEKLQKIKIPKHLSNISQNSVKLSHARFQSMKTTHPEATDSSALRIQKLLLKLSLNMKVMKLIKLLSSHQKQRQIIEKCLITFSLRTFPMNGQRTTSKKLLVFSVKLPPSSLKSSNRV